MEFVEIETNSFGAIVRGIDCAHISDKEASILKQALCEHQLLVFPNQEALTPRDEVAFYKQLDPNADTVWRDQCRNPWEVYKVKAGNQAGTYQIPEEPGVLVLGQGKIDHFGLAVELGGKRRAYGDDSGSQVLGGGALQWHIDGAFYHYDPCRFTQMRCVEAPRKTGHWLEYADDTGARLWAQAGSTAFASGRIAFDRLSQEQKHHVQQINVHYAARPFETAHRFPNSANGLRVVDAELETRFVNTGEDEPGNIIEDDAAKIYPLIWGCRDTGKKALMAHPRCLHHLEDKINGRHLGVVESRLLVENLMRSAIEPDLVYVHPWAPGDLVIWDNHSVWHSATGRLDAKDRRVMHLTAFNGPAP